MVAGSGGEAHDRHPSGTDRAGGGPDPWPAGTTLVVLSGGTSRRLGRDKATTHVGGRTLLDRILAPVPDDVPVVLVGPRVPGLPDRVRVVREDPPGSGPVAGIGAGLAEVRTDLVGVLAADMPFATGVLAAALAQLARQTDDGTGPAPIDAIVPIDRAGHLQLLCAAYRTDRLRSALAAIGPLEGRAARGLLAALRVMEWPVRHEDLADVDTTHDLSAARTRAREEGSGMEQWLAAVSEALGLQVDLDVDSVLDVARDAAHNVQRPAAPLTTYLLGAAVAKGADPAEAAATVSRLAVEWAARNR